MSLLNNIIDDFIDKKIGDGNIVTVRDVRMRYKGKYTEEYLRSVLSSVRFIKRVGCGVYKISPMIIERRKKERADKKPWWL